jgi:3-oxoacyl-[acyl-carrier protein] reductase
MPPESTGAPDARTAGRLAGKAAIVTGAASGIGLASARRFVREGARVLFADLDGERAAAGCADLGEDAAACAVDVRDGEAVQAMVDTAVERFGGVDVLFNNAGVAEAVKPIEQVDRAGGSIILISSIAARRPRSGMAAYVAAKSGAIGLARELALELAPDIRVNVINPGPAHTPMLREFNFADSEEQALANLGQALPLGRAIEPEDIAAAAVYLAGDEARMVTGAILNVDGGRDL